MNNKNLWANGVIYIFLPLCCAVFNILKVFILPDCLAFDLTDDANHTFVNLSVANEMMRQGIVPQINLLNNFGTPFPGDSVTFPYASHAITYWLLPFGVAMTVNRFVIGFMTICALVYYYRQHFSRITSVVCAILVFYMPGFIWHFAHHHYQTVLFYTVVALIFARRCDKASWFFAGLSVIFTMFVLSTNLNMVGIAFVLLLLYQTIDQPRRLWLMLLAMGVGLAFSLFDILYFLKAVAYSVRVVQSYSGAHLKVAGTFPLAILMVALAGLFRLIYARHNTMARTMLWHVVLCGLLPIVCVLFLQQHPDVWQRVPLLRSTDITRVWWISGIFVMLSVGVAMDEGRAVLSRPWMQSVWTYMLGGVLIFFQLHFAATRVLGYSNLKVCRPVDGAHSHHFSPEGWDQFPARTFIPYIQPYARFVSDEESWNGFDLKITRDGVFAGGGRSVFVHQKFADYLISQDVIAIDQTPVAYHFKQPWDSDKLSRLGIRYVMQKGVNQDLADRGWSLLTHFENFWFLYENPVDTGLFYLEYAGGRTVIKPEHIEMWGNGFNLNIAAAMESRVGCQLVATFLALPGWRAVVDGESRPIIVKGDQFIRLDVASGDDTIRLEFVGARPF